MSIVNTALTYLAVKIFWKRPEHLAKVISGFQSTEADGAWHLLYCLDHVDDPKTRAVLFQHLAEEDSHAEAFQRVSKKFSEKSLQPAAYERKALFPLTVPIWRYVAYFHVGEENATEQFSKIAGFLPKDHPLFVPISKITRDEQGHQGLTQVLAKSLGATDGELRSSIRAFRLQRLKELWMKQSRKIADRVATLALSTAYYVLAIFCHSYCEKRLKEKFVAYDNSFHKRLTQ